MSGSGLEVSRGIKTSEVSKELWEINVPLCHRGKWEGMREITLKELLVRNERDGLLMLFFLPTIDQPEGLEVFGLEVSKPLPCLLWSVC